LLVALALAALSNLYAGLILGVITIVAVPAFWLTPEAPALRSLGEGAARDFWLTAAVLAAAAVAALAVVALVAPMVFHRAAEFAIAPDDLARYTARWRDYVWPPSDPRDPAIVERQVTLGFSVLVLAAIAVVAWFRSPRAAAVRAVPALVVIAAAAILCALPQAAATLNALAPMFRSYARFAGVAQLMTAIVAGIGLSVLWQQRRTRAAAVLLSLAAAFEYLPWPPPSFDVLPTSAHRYLAGLTRQPNAASLRAFSCTSASIADLNTPWLMKMPLEFARTEVECSEPQITDALRARGITHVIVHADLPIQRRFQFGHDDRATEVHRGSDASVFALTGPMPELVMSLQSPEHTRESSPARTWIWSAGKSTLEVENLSGAPITRALEVELAAFASPRRVVVELNGAYVTSIVVDPGERMYRIDGLAFRAGTNRLEIAALAPPSVPAALGLGTDQRALAFSIGRWRWR
jgi:hypothetical protein